jgi:hypothetical protein
MRRRSTSSHSRVLCMSDCSSGAVPVFERASTLRSASKDGTGIPLPWRRSRRCTRSIFAGPGPGIGSLEKVVNVPPAYLGSPVLLGRSTGRGCFRFPS